jgi:hypothetical protein
MPSMLKWIDPRPELAGIDFGKVAAFLKRRCLGCGHEHQGILIEDGVMRCRGCGHREDGGKPPKPAPKVKARVLPFRRAAPVRRSRTRAPRRRLAMRCGWRRSGDDGSGGDGDGGDGPPGPAALRRSAWRRP